MPSSALESPAVARFAWGRVGLVSFWVLTFGLIAAEVASSWEEIVGSLARAPRQETLR